MAARTIGSATAAAAISAVGACCVHCWRAVHFPLFGGRFLVYLLTDRLVTVTAVLLAAVLLASLLARPHHQVLVVLRRLPLSPPLELRQLRIPRPLLLLRLSLLLPLLAFLYHLSSLLRRFPLCLPPRPPLLQPHLLQLPLPLLLCHLQRSFLVSLAHHSTGPQLVLLLFHARYPLHLRLLGRSLGPVDLLHVYDRLYGPHIGHQPLEVQLLPLALWFVSEYAELLQ